MPEYITYNIEISSDDSDREDSDEENFDEKNQEQNSRIYIRFQAIHEILI